ncbi:hypothetical protein ABBQ32_002139 [Trebouxia sp. C0010 RCD-2024]
MILGDATPNRLLTSQLSRRTSEYSTPRRTSCGLAAIGPSDLLSPTELDPASRQISDTRKAASPSSTAPAAASPLDQQAQPQAAAPLGTMTCSAGGAVTLHEAAEAGGPAGSLVSTQLPAAPLDSPSSMSASSVSADTRSVHQESHPHDHTALSQASHQLHRPLASPAADMASRAYPLPAAPSEDGALSTPQGSGQFDAHIVAAPTPYPSLASDFSQPGSPVSPKGSGAQYPPVGNPSSGALPAGNSPDHKSRFALTASGRGDSAEEDCTVMDAQGAVSSTGAATGQAEASPSTCQAPPQHGSTAASEQPVADRAQDSNPVEAKPNCGPEQDQQAQARSDAELAGLKLDDADSEQLQLALALSLGQQEAEMAHDVAQGAMHDQGNPPASESAPHPDSAESVLPPPDKHNTTGTDASPDPLPASVSLEATEAGSSGTEAATLPAMRSAAAGGQGADQGDPPSSSPVLPTPSQPATGAHEASSSSGALAEPSQQAAAQEHQQGHLLAAHSDAGASQPEKPNRDQRSDRPDGDVATQQSSDGASLPTFAGSRQRTASDQDEKSKAAAQAHIIQDFLDSSPSQLTYHGLASVREGLRPNELAVFFRNNHFNTIFLHKGVAHLLVTDQGYEFEKNVVWEKLDDLMGNTQFLKADFTPYGSTSLSEQVSDAADLVQAAFAGVAPTKAHASSGVGAVDADFALALQLHQEEERRAAARQQQSHAQHHGLQGTSQSQQQSSGRSGSSGSSQGRPPRGRTSDQGPQSFANPMQRHQQSRVAQQAPGQDRDKPSIGNAVAKWFGFGSKK